MKQDQILFTPLDLPSLDLNHAKIKSWRRQQDSDQTFDQRFFRTVFLRGARNPPAKSAHSLYNDQLEWHWNDTAKLHFPEIIDGLQALPFKTITMVTFVGNKNNGDLPPHHDHPPHQLPHYVRDNEPYSYRISIGDTRDAFFVCDKQGINDEELATGRYMFGNLPPETNWWCMSCSKCFHSTLPREDKETLFISGILDAARHSELIMRSYERFKSSAITVQRLIEEGQPLKDVIRKPWHDLKARHPELYQVES